ncbi:MAG TPA: hypothetical protein VN452_04175 [Longilinea sp.]|nr:hypothetical protein [Longilinea sp.]
MNGKQFIAGLRRPVVMLLFAAVTVLVIAAILQTVPGYMDAEYYYVGGQQLFLGRGFTEPFLWNYLDQPAGLPHPAFTYWMPLASILSFIGMRLTGAGSFLAARWPFLLFSALIPWLTYRLTRAIGAKPATAQLAGWLAVFPGFYLVYSTLTETFALYMLGGTLFFLIISLDGRRWKTNLSWLRFGILGLIAGWMHASRADGLLWFGLAGLVWIVEIFAGIRNKSLNWKQAAGGFASVLLGYILVMGAWYARNVNLYGVLFLPGGARTLWLINYDQTFTLDANTLTPQSWLAAGWAEMMKARGWALILNLKNFIAVQGSVFLLPFILVGLWTKRKIAGIQYGMIGWVLTLAAMTLVFPFSGSRGGFLHSGAAFQPLFWACAAVGLDNAITYGASKRSWSRKMAWRVFSISAVVLAALVTVWAFWGRVLHPDLRSPGWITGQENYRAVGAYLDQNNIPETDLFLVNDPPGFFLATGRSSIVIPDGGEQELFAAAQKYGAKYLVLDQNNPKLIQLYQSENGIHAFVFVNAVGPVKIYQVIEAVKGPS